MSGGSVWVSPAGRDGLLQANVARAWAYSPVQRARLEEAGIDPDRVMGPEDLRRLPVMRKEDLGAIQALGRPFGGLLGEELGDLARIFLSPGDIYDPQGDRPDFWRLGRALMAAGFERGEVVINCFNYHLSPAGFMFDGAARATGCVVIPAGVGQQEMQIRVIRETGATAYVGLPSYLLALLEKAGGELPLRKALVTGEPLPPTLRARIQEFGVDLYQAYGTADLGLVAYECSQKEGMHLDEGVVVEFCDPNGDPVPVGEVGEMVVTLLDPTYPLLRFGTGDLSALVAGPCACGRTALRMKGWLGRANDVVKVRGMFVYPRQLEEAMAPFADRVARWQAVVERDQQHRDHLRLLVEVQGDLPDMGVLAEAIRSATRLTAGVEAVGAGTLPEGAPRLEDRRRWE